MRLNIEQFEAGHYESGYEYKYFVPNSINLDWVTADSEVWEIFGSASRSLGKLDSYSHLVPNVDLFIRLLVTKESVTSSRIEGTQTSMDEALLPESEIPQERRNDRMEVLNYTEALNSAIERLAHLPLSTRLLCETHRTLLQGVRGEHKNPGEFRISQNWIGSSLKSAVFVPPRHELVGPLMGDLENFLHNDQIHVPKLIRIAIAHYQFETIHPFLDGNGRIGRLLITLYLVDQQMLGKPLLYLSRFFEQKKEHYYNALTRVRTHNELSEWIKYFLIGVQETADHGIETLEHVLKLKAEIESEITSAFGRRVSSAYLLLRQLFQTPFVTIADVCQCCNLSAKTANDLVQEFVQRNWLREMTGYSRNRIFEFSPYMRIFE